MKWIFSFSALSLLAACQPAKQEFNGREASYALTPRSPHPISRSVTFKKKPRRRNRSKDNLEGHGRAPKIARAFAFWRCEHDGGAGGFTALPGGCANGNFRHPRYSFGRRYRNRF